MERLWESSLYTIYEKAVAEKNVSHIVQILKELELDRRDIIPIIKSLGLYTPSNDYQYCMSKGERADVDGNYLDALSLYEAELYGPLPSMENAMNLAHLYWRSLSQGPCPIQNLSSSIPDESAIEKLNLTLNYSSVISDFEASFWRIYYLLATFKPIVLFSETDWKLIIERYSSLAPPPPEMYFVCYSVHPDKYKEHMVTFYQECLVCPTARNLYIKRIIDNVKETIVV